MSGPTPSAIASLLKSQLTYCPSLPNSPFTDQTAIVTGANTGLGRETAQHLVRSGASLVILAVRTPSKGEAAIQYIKEQTGRRGCMQVWQLDMSSFDSVKQFAQRAETELERLDVLVCNAGIWPSKFEVAEGYEATITVNVLSTLLLTRLLLPQLRRSSTTTNSTARVTLLSSALHKFATLPARNNASIFATYTSAAPPLRASDFDKRYYDSKLLLMLYGLHLASTLDPVRVCLTFVNPGWCASGLTRSSKLAEKVLRRTTEQGARIIVDAVGGDRVHGRHGQYLDDCKVGKMSEWLASVEGIDTGRRVVEEVNGILERHLT